MDNREREVLAALRFEAVPTERTVWSEQLSHVNGLNQPVYDRVRREISALRSGRADSPPGLVVHGEQGSGKSHLMWWSRQLVSGMGGYFFNIQPDGRVDTLWTRVVNSIVTDLQEPLRTGRPTAQPVTQLSLFLKRLCAKKLDMDEPAVKVLCGEARITSAEALEKLADFSDRLRSVHPNRDLRNAARALVLIAIRDDDANIAGTTYLRGNADEEDSRRRWGLLPVDPGAPDILVRHLSSVLAMAGPSVFVVDQIDNMVVQSGHSTEDAGSVDGSADLAAALMTIREKLSRSITVISCLDHTWETIRSRATRTALDRFHDEYELSPIRDPRLARRLIAKFLNDQYYDMGFVPPHATWPIPDTAFDEVAGILPRQLIQHVGSHVRACLDADALVPLKGFGEHDPEPVVDEETARVQERYLDHLREVPLDSLKETKAERELGRTLTAAATALAVELGCEDRVTIQEVGKGAESASTHCNITTPDGTTIFLRGVNTTRASAVGSRLDNAREVAFAEPQPSHLLIVNTNPWKLTPRVERAMDDVKGAGGTIIHIGDEELRTLKAVQLTTTGSSDEVLRWQRHYRLMSSTQLGSALLPLLSLDTDEPAEPAVGPEPSPTTEPSIVDNAIPLGEDDSDKVINLDLEALRKHIAVFASSGSGKTVLLRRVIEECALRGVSTIVLDPNNDLARLGDPWPCAPTGWWPGDAERATDYLDGTDVVVWTPGVTRGNPLTLQPFPDFTAVADDPDELRLAVDIAVAALAPRARIDGENHQSDGRRAVLRETMMRFARRGGGDLAALIDMLLAPPDEVLDLPSAAKHASYVASALSYARSNDPLFDGEGTPFDPDRLLTPANGFRARVSVINLAGVPDDNRPAFINRLQMALFSWIKRHPARDKPLSGLFIMDEAQTFIPSGRSTPCTESTRNLASQARKYGLGLLYATQAPRGIDSRITGNAASHIYGRVTVPAHVGAVNAMARARGEEPPRITGLTAGHFFASLEGRPLAAMTVPMCLSHHGSPLEEAEIIQRARDRR